MSGPGAKVDEAVELLTKYGMDQTIEEEVQKFRALSKEEKDNAPKRKAPEGRAAAGAKSKRRWGDGGGGPHDSQWSPRSFGNTWDNERVHIARTQGYQDGDQ